MAAQGAPGLRPTISPRVLELASIETSAPLEAIVAGFVPTPRFRQVSFASYRPDPAYPSQAAARDRLHRFVTSSRRDGGGPSWLSGLSLPSWLQASGPDKPRGIYLDGGFGVGKTHLLAAAYHAAPGPKAYLSFAELTYTIIQMGLQPSIAAFRPYRLICLDEFELDDIASTHMAASFLRAVMEGGDGARVVTTSNTLPSQLGQGSFAASEFRREIGQIAAQFEVVTIDGEDYRHRPREEAAPAPARLDVTDLRRAFEAARPLVGAKVYTRHTDLMAQLARLHPIRYARLLEPIGALFVEGLAPMPDQNVALRFVHLVDKLYDQQVRLTAALSCPPIDLFSAEYRDKGYAKKYRRCLSRLHELLVESAHPA